MFLTPINIPKMVALRRGVFCACSEYLHYYFKDAGYQNIIFYDSLHGFTILVKNAILDNFAKMAEMFCFHMAI